MRPFLAADYHHQNIKPQALFTTASAAKTALNDTIKRQPEVHSCKILKPSQATAELDTTSSSKRTSFAHQVLMPSCLINDKVVADKPKNTPAPAMGIKACAR